jgi:hypothetical protein
MRQLHQNRDVEQDPERQYGPPAKEIKLRCKDMVALAFDKVVNYRDFQKREKGEYERHKDINVQHCSVVHWRKLLAY